MSDDEPQMQRKRRVSHVIADDEESSNASDSGVHQHLAAPIPRAGENASSVTKDAGAQQVPLLAVARPAQATSLTALSTSRSRLARCGQCAGCTRANCGMCSACLDMPAFGGAGTRRQVIHATQAACRSNAACAPFISRMHTVTLAHLTRLFAGVQESQM